MHILQGKIMFVLAFLVSCREEKEFIAELISVWHAWCKSPVNFNIPASFPAHGN
jgi:hypothetical protein